MRPIFGRAVFPENLRRLQDCGPLADPRHIEELRLMGPFTAGIIPTIDLSPIVWDPPRSIVSRREKAGGSHVH